MWETVRDIGSHVRWMEDAAAIRFTSPHRSGLGARFECDTRVGPLRLLDTMEITEWKEGSTIGIRHTGLVSGHGRFSLERRRGGTRFVWEEQLAFPAWLGGTIGGLAARPVLTRVWRRNLANLKALIEAEDRRATRA